MPKDNKFVLEEKLKEIEMRNIDERKRAEAVSHENERLRGIIEKAGTVCHDLNQPLMAISGFSTLISMNLPPDDPVCEMADKMADQVSKMGRITRKLLGIMRHERKELFTSKTIDSEQLLQ